jgi:hypothetical protein
MRCRRTIGTNGLGPLRAAQIEMREELRRNRAITTGPAPVDE